MNQYQVKINSYLRYLTSQTGVVEVLSGLQA